MGIFKGANQQEIEQFLAQRGINAAHSYVVAQPKDSIIRQIAVLLISNLVAAMDASRIRIIAATPEELVVINPSHQLAGNVKDLPDRHVQRIPFANLEEYTIDEGSRNGTITWKYNGKRETWKVPLANPGVFHFNPANFREIARISKHAL